jgi:cation diffusion facilitator family transporter
MNLSKDQGSGQAEPGTVARADQAHKFPGAGLGSVAGQAGSGSLLTVLVALGANVLVAGAKSVAAVVTGSASMAAESAHSWADTGNELLLLVANRRSARPPDLAHPLGHGREAYVWSLLAAVGLFVAGGAVSITHGVNELRAPAPAGDFVVGYVVLAVSFLLEGTSLLRSIGQATPAAEAMHRDLIEHVLATSDPTLRAVFAEDAAALIGLVLAAAGLAAHQLTGSAVPDAIGSIAVGVLLTVVAFVLINRNRRFLVGQEADPRVRAAVLQELLAQREVARVTYLWLEVVGPRMISVVGDVDLTGDDIESHVAVRLRALEAKISSSPSVAGALLSLSAPDEPDLTA